MSEAPKALTTRERTRLTELLSRAWVWLGPEWGQDKLATFEGGPPATRGDDGGGRWGSLAFYPYVRPTTCRDYPGLGRAHVGDFRADQCGDCHCGAVRLCGCGRCIQDTDGGKASRMPDRPVLDARRARDGSWTA